MAGHSQFKNIMYRKGAQDKKRAKLFAKLAKEITVAAKMGLPDPEYNPRLRAAIQQHAPRTWPRAENMAMRREHAVAKKRGEGRVRGILYAAFLGVLDKNRTINPKKLRNSCFFPK